MIAPNVIIKMFEQPATGSIAPDLPLRCSTRDRLVNSLNQFNALLMGRPEDDEGKKRMGELNDLIFILTGLPLKTNDAAVSKVMDTAKVGNGPFQQADEPIFDLPTSMSFQIIDQLINLGAVHLVSTNAETKTRIMSQNIDMILKLMKLQERSAAKEMVIEEITLSRGSEPGEDEQQAMSVQTDDHANGM